VWGSSLLPSVRGQKTRSASPDGVGGLSPGPTAVGANGSDKERGYIIARKGLTPSLLLKTTFPSTGSLQVQGQREHGEKGRGRNG
jgi:hypothetical protein